MAGRHHVVANRQMFHVKQQKAVDIGCFLGI